MWAIGQWLKVIECTIAASNAKAFLRRQFGLFWRHFSWIVPWECLISSHSADGGYWILKTYVCSFKMLRCRPLLCHYRLWTCKCPSLITKLDISRTNRGRCSWLWITSSHAEMPSFCFIALKMKSKRVASYSQCQYFFASLRLLMQHLCNKNGPLHLFKVLYVLTNLCFIKRLILTNRCKLFLEALLQVRLNNSVLCLARSYFREDLLRLAPGKRRTGRLGMFTMGPESLPYWARWSDIPERLN